MSVDDRVLLPGIPGGTSRGYLGFCTVYLFRLDDRWALFDVGHYGDRHLLQAALSAAGLTPGEIEFVVLSHLHFDHSLNLPLFPRAEIFISAAELDELVIRSVGLFLDGVRPRPAGCGTGG